MGGFGYSRRVNFKFYLPTPTSHTSNVDKITQKIMGVAKSLPITCTNLNTTFPGQC